MTPQQWIAFIRANAARYGVDPRAALAVASQEGLSGRVGDAGTSFGPFQLHVGGALPKGRGRAWAESPEGILYALRQMGQVSGGLTGRQAINAIVRRFERPADPDSEVAGAIGAYGDYGGSIGDAVANAVFPAGKPPKVIPAGGPPPVIPGTGKPRKVTTTVNQRVFDNAALAQGIFGSLAGGDTPDVASLVSGAWRNVPVTRTSVLPPVPGMAQPPPVPPRPPGARAPVPTAPGARYTGALAEAFYDPLGSWDNGAFGGAIGGHSDHVHLSITKAAAMLAAIRRAQAMGLRVGENPYVDKVDPVHVGGSFHYRDFPGQYGGRPLGEAIDVSGNAARMAAFYRWATANLR